MPKTRRLAISLAIAGASFCALMYWYQWSARVLTQDEIDSYLARISTQTQQPGGRHDLPALRRFLESDDGGPVYTVNLYAFNSVADYPAGSGFSGSGVEAYDRFSAVMIPLMAARGSHPVFGSDWADPSSGDWDRIVLVRYRSRRDLVDLFATDAFAEASLHKWASIRRHERMLVTALHIPGGEWVILVLSLLAGSGAYAIGCRGGLRPQRLRGA